MFNSRENYGDPEGKTTKRKKQKQKENHSKKKKNTTKPNKQLCVFVFFFFLLLCFFILLCFSFCGCCFTTENPLNVVSHTHTHTHTHTTCWLISCRCTVTFSRPHTQLTTYKDQDSFTHNHQKPCLLTLLHLYQSQQEGKWTRHTPLQLYWLCPPLDVSTGLQPAALFEPCGGDEKAIFSSCKCVLSH